MVPALYPLASLTQIQITPSQQDAIPPHLEDDLRAYGCKLIHQAGFLLKQSVLLPSAFALALIRQQETGCCCYSSDPLPEVLVRQFHETLWRSSTSLLLPLP